MPRPRVGDGVWVSGHKQPNGKIKYIDWEGDKEVIVECYDTHEQVTVEWSEFDQSTFNERLNQWIINRG